MESTQHLLSSILEVLEEEIVLGRLRPYQELLEDTLMQRFDVKRHVARAAIRELAEKGLVVKPKNKSARVKDYSPEEVYWIYDVRITLCVRAVEIMPLPASKQLLQELKAIHQAHVDAVSEQRLRDVRALNDGFHDAVFGACGNPYLVADIARYNRLIDPIRSTGIADKKWLAQSVRDHAAITLAIKQGDREALRKRVVDHMLPVRDAWLKDRVLPL